MLQNALKSSLQRLSLVIVPCFLTDYHRTGVLNCFQTVLCYCVNITQALNMGFLYTGYAISAWLFCISPLIHGKIRDWRGNLQSVVNSGDFHQARVDNQTFEETFKEYSLGGWDSPCFVEGSPSTYLYSLLVLNHCKPFYSAIPNLSNTALCSTSLQVGFLRIHRSRYQAIYIHPHISISTEGL